LGWRKEYFGMSNPLRLPPSASATSIDTGDVEQKLGFRLQASVKPPESQVSEKIPSPVRFSAPVLVHWNPTTCPAGNDSVARYGVAAGGASAMRRESLHPTTVQAVGPVTTQDGPDT
jgi:hypothetical protein